MKTTYALVSLIFATVAVSGCAILTHQDQPQAAIQFNYSLQDPQATGIIQAFDMDGNTVIHMADNQSRQTEVFDHKGTRLTFKKVGQYVVLPGIYSSVRVLSNGYHSFVVRKDGAFGVPTTVAGPTISPQPAAAIPVQKATYAEPRMLNQQEPIIDDNEPHRQELVRIRKELEELKALLAKAARPDDPVKDSYRNKSPATDITVVRVSFKFNSTSFDPPKDVRDTLQHYAKHADEITVKGFTDSGVPTQPDLTVATNRAQAARRFLLAQGVQSRKISTSAQAAGGFIADNGTAEGRALNRRVEIEMALPEKYARQLERRQMLAHSNVE